MNTEGCAEGYFTDNIMRHNPPLCDSPVVAWVVLVSLTCLVRILVGLVLYYNTKRKVTIRAELNNNNKTQFSWQTKFHFLVEFLTSFGLVLFAILTSLNIANFQNGLSPLIWVLAASPLLAGHAMEIRITIRLGKRLIPLSKKFHHQLDGSKLDRVDSVLKIGFTLAILSGVTIFVLWGIVGVILPNREEFTQGGLWILVVYVLSAGLSTFWQMQRCIRAILSLVSSEATDNGVRKAILTLRLFQVIVALTGTVICVIVILMATLVIPFAWYMVWIVLFAGDTAYQILLLATTMRNNKQSKRHVANAPSNDKNNMVSMVTSPVTESRT